MQSQRESYDKLEGGFRTEDIAAARARKQAAKFELESAEADSKRFRALLDTGAIARQKYEQVHTRHEAARGNYLAAGENLRKLESGYLPQERRAAYQGYQVARAGYEELVAGTRPELIASAQSEVDYWKNQLSLTQEGPRSEDIEAAAASVKKAEAEIKFLQVQLSKSQLTSPVTGIVTQRPFEHGELVPAGPAVFTVTELDRPWVSVFVPETEMAQIQLGAQCQVTVDSLPGTPLTGRVSWISQNAEFTPRFIQTERQRVDLVFQVKVQVENSGLELKPGMPADVQVRQGQSDG
jgi:HlyD family secretion protein